MDISFTDFNWFRGQGSGRCCHSGMGTYLYICVCLAKENIWKNISEEKFTPPQENKPLKFGVDTYDCMKSWYNFLSNEFIGKIMKISTRSKKKIEMLYMFCFVLNRSWITGWGRNVWRTWPSPHLHYSPWLLC